MKNILFTLALLVSFTSTLAQNIDKLKKRELRELANTQKKQLVIKNSKIDDQITIIENSSARITELIQIKTQLEKFKLSSLDSINKLNSRNAIIPVLENEIIKLTDSINSINKLLSSYTSQDSFPTNQNTYRFLNNLYLGNSQIENQTFRLVPAGVIARNNLIDHGNNRRGDAHITRFIPMAKLNIGIQNKEKIQLVSEGYNLNNFKNFIKDSYKIISGVELYNSYPEIFPTFSFLKGKLLTITNENVSKDFLFSVKEKVSEKSLNDQLGQKGIYFSLTDDNEVEYLLELIVINDEVYLRINSEGSGNHNNSLEKIGMKLSITHSYESKVVKYWIDGYDKTSRESSYYISSSSVDLESSSRAEYYLECDQFYISPWLIPSIYESSVRIIPNMFLFKLEEIQ